jgi:nucleoside-diphosphate-sugar epimerase
VIVYNGASGGLGSHLGPAIRDARLRGYAIQSRLEDAAGLRSELLALHPAGRVVFIHLAARVSVPQCEADPAGAFRVNVELTRRVVAEVLQWSHHLRLPTHVLYVSTGHVYAPSPEPNRTAEDGLLQPRSVYAQTKLEAEKVLQSLSAERHVPLTVARIFGLVGPGQRDGYILPSLMRRVVEGRTGVIPGLHNVRDWLDTRDACDDLVALARCEPPEGNRVVNICSGKANSVRSLLQLVAIGLDPDHAESLVTSASEAPGRPDDVPWLVGSPARFQALTGVEPSRRSLAASVADAVRASREGLGHTLPESGLPVQRA